MASIRCAHCTLTHSSVERVRECAEIEQMHQEVCEHGLAAWLCAGPQHYPFDDEEIQQMGWFA